MRKKLITKKDLSYFRKIADTFSRMNHFMSVHKGQPIIFATFNSRLSSQEEFRKLWAKFRRKLRKSYNFKCIGVIEHQRNKKNFHAHLLFVVENVSDDKSLKKVFEGAKSVWRKLHDSASNLKWSKKFKLVDYAWVKPNKNLVTYICKMVRFPSGENGKPIPRYIAKQYGGSGSFQISSNFNCENLKLPSDTMAPTTLINWLSELFHEGNYPYYAVSKGKPIEVSSVECYKEVS